MALESRQKARLEDPGADLLDQFTDYWNRYGQTSLIVLGALAVIGVGAFFVLRARRTAEDQAAGKLAEATLAYFQSDLGRAGQLAKQVAEQYPNTASGNDAHRLVGDASFWNSDFKTAIAEYRRYLSRQSPGLLADAATRSLAYALENDHQYVEAAKSYDSLVGKFDRESSAEFLAAAARCLRLAGDKDGARKHLERIAGEFGDTSYAREARIEAAELAAHP